MSTFADKRALVERLLALHGWETTVHRGSLTQAETEFAEELRYAGLLSDRDSAGWAIAPSDLSIFRTLQTGTLRRLATSDRLGVLADHDLVRRKGALWRWAWIE